MAAPHRPSRRAIRLTGDDPPAMRKPPRVETEAASSKGRYKYDDSPNAEDAQAERIARVADVLASSCRWLTRERDIMLDPSRPDDGWTSLTVETRDLEICLHNMEQTVAFLRRLAGEGSEA